MGNREKQLISIMPQLYRVYNVVEMNAGLLMDRQGRGIIWEEESLEEIQYLIYWEFINNREISWLRVYDEKEKQCYYILDLSQYWQIAGRQYLEQVYMEQLNGQIEKYDAVFSEFKKQHVLDAKYLEPRNTLHRMRLYYQAESNLLSPEENFISEILRKTDSSHVLLVSCPYVFQIQNQSERERWIASMIGISEEEWTLQEQERMQEPYVEYGYSNEKMQEILEGIDFVSTMKGVYQTDASGEFFNVVNGIRVTTDLPDDYEIVVHMFGPSILFGIGVEDDKTIASYLQRMLNGKKDRHTYKVINYGLQRADELDLARTIRKAAIHPGDVVIVVHNRIYEEFQLRCSKEKISYLDTVSIFDRPHDMGEIYIDEGHWIYPPNQRIAEMIFNEWFLDLSVETLEMTPVREEIKEDSVFTDALKESRELEKYLKEINESVGELPGVKGAVVMNCNPFTKGHRYLIEMAAKQVDALYVFVVEEDKSIFPFQERLELVKRGTEDLDTVHVVPSGQFILSNMTFPEYFTKKYRQGELQIDTTKDLTVFAKYIAEPLGITVRFAGKEPFCNVTRQYNENMKQILPQYGIDFVEIPRVQSQGREISATYVRELIEKNQTEDLKGLVPASTYVYLLDKQWITEVKEG